MHCRLTRVHNNNCQREKNKSAMKEKGRRWRCCSRGHSTLGFLMWLATTTENPQAAIGCGVDSQLPKATTSTRSARRATSRSCRW
eukprot:7600099-Heterocapsa_arctica.AAC.1